MSKTTRRYEVRFNGEVVGTRKSESRDYTHAVVVRKSESYAWNLAYNRAGNKYWQKTDRANYEYRLWVATAAPGSIRGNGFTFTHDYSPEDVAKAKAEVEGGLAGYVERQRLREIARFEEAKARGEFDYGVACYNGRRDLAEKEAARLRTNPWFDEVHVVEVTRLA